MIKSVKLIDPVGEAIQVFMSLKNKIVDRLGDSKLSDGVGSKLRARSREVPEMILEQGLVPTLSFCLAKAGIENVEKVVGIMERDESIDEVKDKEIESEKLAYALYTYAILKYLTLISGKSIEGIIENDVENGDKLFNYLGELIMSNTRTPLYRMLQPYLLQFKRLCEATFKPGRG
ncbi:MAG: type III-B CRISPR module-associated protein Cmr5 [Infirmifilum sp.]